MAHFNRLYSNMRRGIVAHDMFLGEHNLAALDAMDFVFVCLEGPAKRMVIERLEANGTPFIDVGIGITLVDGSLVGVLRVTTSTPAMRGHVRERGRIPLAAAAPGDYDTNIQVAELNALNAALAVIKWKKLVGFYQDREQERFSTYTIDTGMLLNEDLSMKREVTLRHEFVEFIPDQLAERTLYVSVAYATAAHLCCCGCGRLVVTPLSPTDWALTFDGETITLNPSVGNWSFPCQSHYWIRKGRAAWAPRWTRREIEAGRERDRDAKREAYRSPAKPAAHKTKRKGWRGLKRWFGNGG